MALTPEQLQRRSKLIGSSDAAAVVGVDPYRNARDVWLEKTGRAVSFAGNEATERGNFLEPAILNYAEAKLGVKLQRDVMIVDPTGALCANLDGITPDALRIVEAKSSTQPELWGEENSDAIPNQYVVQCHHQFGVASIEVATVVALLPLYRRFEFRTYEIECNRELRDRIIEIDLDFFEKHVKRDTPPEGEIAHIDTLKRIRREPKSVCVIPDSIARGFIEAKAALKIAEDDERAAYADLVSAMGEAEAAEWSGGEFTYFEQKRKAYSVAESIYRVLRKVK